LTLEDVSWLVPREELSVDTTHVSDAKITIALPLRNVVGITVTLCEERDRSGEVRDLERQTWQAKRAGRIDDWLIVSCNYLLPPLPIKCISSKANLKRCRSSRRVQFRSEVVSCLHTCESASASHSSSHDCILQTQHSAPLVHVFACINRPVNQSLEALTPAVYDCT
jgi:hypothetical protein